MRSLESRLIFGVGKLHHIHSSRSRQLLLRHAIDVGFRSFDVAPAYGNGLNELEVGKALYTSRYSCEVTTKFGIPVDLYGARYPRAFIYQRLFRMIFDRHYGSEYSKREIEAGVMELSIEGSLRRLNREYVDTYLIHEPLREFGTEELQLLNYSAGELRRKGKIRGWGIAGPLTHLRSSALASDFDTLQFPIQELLAPHTRSTKRLIAYGAYKQYKQLAVTEDFMTFVRKLLQQTDNLSLILSTTNIETLERFRLPRV